MNPLFCCTMLKLVSESSFFIYSILRTGYLEFDLTLKTDLPILKMEHQLRTLLPSSAVTRDSAEELYFHFGKSYIIITLYYVINTHTQKEIDN